MVQTDRQTPLSPLDYHYKVVEFSRMLPPPSPPNSQAGPTPTSLTPWRAHRVTGRVEAAYRVEEVPGA